MKAAHKSAGSYIHTGKSDKRSRCSFRLPNHLDRPPPTRQSFPAHPQKGGKQAPGPIRPPPFPASKGHSRVYRSEGLAPTGSLSNGVLPKIFRADLHPPLTVLFKSLSRPAAEGRDREVFVNFIDHHPTGLIEIILKGVHQNLRNFSQWCSIPLCCLRDGRGVPHSMMHSARHAMAVQDRFQFCICRDTAFPRIEMRRISFQRRRY